MGGISSKCMQIKRKKKTPKEKKPPLKESVNKHIPPRVHSSRRQDSVRPNDVLETGDVKVVLIDKNSYDSNRFPDSIIDKVEKSEVIVSGRLPGLVKVPKAVERDQVVAGWPSWLVMVAGEALNGWKPRRANTFEKLEKIGQGTYSSVYKARDIIHNKTVALKKVRFDIKDLESVKFMAREIIILRKLDHPNIIKLEGLITSPNSCSLFLIFEYMEHDLVGLSSLPGMKFSEPQVKCYMNQLLSGLDHCHSRGVLHRDIKGSNLLIDSNGILKIADFGLASFFDHRNSTPMTSRVVTLWYRPPELLLGSSRYGVGVDLWSTGCILGELYTGKPILAGKTEVEQLHKVFKLCGSPSEDYWSKSKLHHSSVFKPIHPYKRRVAYTFRDFPTSTVGLIDTLLSVDPEDRGTAASALKSNFFTTDPLACDPSSLPKYPPSKEIDAKLRDQEARRQRTGIRGGERSDLERKGSKAIQDHRTNPPLSTSLQKTQYRSDSKSKSGLLNYHHNDDGHSGYIVGGPTKQRQFFDARRDLSDQQQPRRVSHSGPLGNGWVNKSGVREQQQHQDVEAVSSRQPNFSGLVATRTLHSQDRRERPGPSQPVVNQTRRHEESFNDIEYMPKQDIEDRKPKISDSPQPRGGRTSSNEQTLHGRGPRGNKIYVSGPLLVPSNNVDQMLKDHDRRIEDYARRARLEKKKHGKPFAAQGK